MHPHNFKPILDQYRFLLKEIDSWFLAAVTAHPEQISCGKGCSGCCRGLFDITLLDALFLQQGFLQLPEELQVKILTSAGQRVAGIKSHWPEYAQPFLLNHRPEEDWQILMPEVDETPCVLLDDNGHCLVYEYRPMTCRLHGLPLIDINGELMHDEWCTENFPGVNPVELTGLEGEFDRFFREEVRLDRELSLLLFNRIIYELDTVIPAALLIDFTNMQLSS